MTRPRDLTLLEWAAMLAALAFLAALLFNSKAKGETNATSRTLRMRVSAFCPCKKCCGPKSCGITASGARADRPLVAADWLVLPKGTRVIVPGYAGSKAVQVLDKGGAIKGLRLDVLMLDDPGKPGSGHKAALRWGVKYLDVTVLEGGR